MPSSSSSGSGTGGDINVISGERIKKNVSTTSGILGDAGEGKTDGSLSSSPPDSLSSAKSKNKRDGGQSPGSPSSGSGRSYRSTVQKRALQQMEAAARSAGKKAYGVVADRIGGSGKKSTSPPQDDKKGSEDADGSGSDAGKSFGKSSGGKSSGSNVASTAVSVHNIMPIGPAVGTIGTGAEVLDGTKISSELDYASVERRENDPDTSSSLPAVGNIRRGSAQSVSSTDAELNISGSIAEGSSVIGGEESTIMDATIIISPGPSSAVGGHGPSFTLEGPASEATILRIRPKGMPLTQTKDMFQEHVRRSSLQSTDQLNQQQLQALVGSSCLATALKEVSLGGSVATVTQAVQTNDPGSPEPGSLGRIKNVSMRTDSKTQQTGSAHDPFAPRQEVVEDLVMTERLRYPSFKSDILLNLSR